MLNSARRCNMAGASAPASCIRAVPHFQPTRNKLTLLQPGIGGRASSIKGSHSELTTSSIRPPVASGFLQSGRSCFSDNLPGASHVPRAAAASMPSDDSIKGLIPVGKGNVLDKIRAMVFFTFTLALALPLFVSMTLIAPFVMALDKHRRLAQHFVNNIWAKVSTFLFYPVEVVGRENLPPSDRPVVYVANHQSFLDIFSLFHLDRPFKFISKASIFYIPIVGWSMFLTGHVKLERLDRRSQLDCLKACRELLDKGAPVLFFPEGTRSKDCVMKGFKKGAFSVAVKAGVDVVPMTILGTGALMPSGSESQLRLPGRVKIVVHKPIPTKGRSADDVCEESRNVIASAMPKQLVGSATDMAGDTE